MKRTDNDLDVNTFIDDRYIRAAFKQAGLDYDARLKNYNRLPLVAKDAATGKPVTDFSRLVQIWVEGEPLVRHYTSADAAFAALRQLEKDGKKVRVVYAHDRDSGLKLFARDAWFVSVKGDTSAFLTRASAEAWAARNGGSVVDFAAARGATPALAAK